MAIADAEYKFTWVDIGDYSMLSEKKITFLYILINI